MRKNAIKASPKHDDREAATARILGGRASYIRSVFLPQSPPALARAPISLTRSLSLDMADTAAPAAAPAPAAASPAKAKKATKKAAGPKKPASKPSHPPTAEMVKSAIKTLKERGGSSLQAIKKYISATYKVDAEKLAPFIRKYLKSAVASGALVQTKGKGAAGSFKLSAAAPKEKKPKAAKKPAAKKDKKPAAAKKPKAAAAKKPKSPKKEKKAAAAAKPKKAPTKAKKAKPAAKPKAPKPKKAAAKPKVAKPKPAKK
jgi:histone H1/5